MIYGFHANGVCLLGKIMLKSQIRDLESKVTCYIIDIDTSYNLLLRRPWIHRNYVVPSTLHQAMKYINQEGEVQMLVADKQLFKGVKNYYTDVLLYIDACKANL